MMSQKVVLSVLMLLTAFACIGVGAMLFLRSFSESASLFASSAEALRESDGGAQHIAFIVTAVGAAILVFLRKYWK